MMCKFQRSSILLTMLLLLIWVTALPQATDTSKILVKRETYNVVLAAAFERDVLCEDLNKVNLRLSENARKIKTRNTVIGVLLGIELTRIAASYFK